MSYANTTQYRLIYDTDMEDERLAAWLEKASAWLDLQLGERLDDSNDAQASALQSLCIELVSRATMTPSIGAGVDSYSQGANGFTESYNYSNPTGRFYLYKDERKMLGLGSSIGFASWLGGE